MSAGQGGSVLFEFTEIGGQVRIAAIDERSGIEIVVISPSGATRQQMQQLALAKLRKRMEEAGLRLDGKGGM